MEAERILGPARAFARVGCLVGLLVWPDLPEAQGQIRPGRIRVQIGRGNLMQGGSGEQNGEDAPDSVFYPPDRETLQKLSLSKELIEQERYGEAARLLSGILESPEDYFFQPDRHERIYRSLKSEAQRLLGAMPADGKASYELQYGAEAQRMLDAAVEQGDLAGLAEVSRKYFHTQAGYEATYLLGVAQLQRGEPLAAALSLGRLQGTSAAKQFDPSLSLNLALCWARAGRAEQAAALLKDLTRRMPDAKFRVAGTERKAFSSDAQALAWLAEVATPAEADLDAAQWSMYRGSPSRNAPSAGSSPLLNRRWSVPVADHPRVEELLGKLAQDHLEQSSRLLPGLHPLAVRDYVFMRSLTGLVGVDFHTGKRIWVENEKEHQTNSLVDALAQPPGSRGSAALTHWLERRAWDSAVYGTLSSDGEMIYCIDEPDQGSFTDETAAIDQQMHRQMLFNPRPMMARGAAAQGHNRLVAYEIASQGKLVGEVDTRPGEIQHALTGGFFLGPPLPLGGRLYVLAEIKGEIRLFVLDPKKLRGEGEKDDVAVEWSQQLVVLDPVVFEEPLRRLAGATPSFSDGILVCPTSAGAVVAVDLTTRSLLWGYQYPRATDALNNRLMVRFPGMPQINEPADDNRWADASVTIADGHVLLTPLESDEIYCLNLTDGSLRWHKPRDDGLYLACVYDGKAVVVGSRSVKALRLADGEAAWPLLDQTHRAGSLALPASGGSGSMPSGRGFYNDHRYYLPLSSAEVVAIDLDQGQIVARSRSRTGTVPGNLICYDGAVISQGVDHVESFYQLDELRQQVAATLANSPDDPDALARQGELLLDEGRFDEAVAELRRSYQSKADPRTRELLVDGMLESLRLDFAKHRDLAPEIERLAEQPAEHAKLARLLAGGLQQTGEIAAAFDAYLGMVDLKSDPQPYERVESGLSVRRDRWVRARLSQLHDAASADDRRAMHDRIGRLLKQSLDVQDSATLKRFVGYFAYHPLADDARERLAEQALVSKNWLEAEHWLRQLEPSADRARGRAAVARLAQLLCDAGRPADAVASYRQLAGEWADELCLAGRRGCEIARDLAARPQIARLVGGSAGWPRGKVEVQSENVQNGQALRSVPIEFRGSPEPFFARATVEVDANMQQNALIGRDGTGHEQWRLPLRDHNNNLGLNPAIDYVRADGHLLVLSLGYQLVGIDTLGAPNSGARVLWKQEIGDSLNGLPRQFAMNPRNIRIGMAGQHMQPVDANGRPLGNTSPITSELVCFQRMRELMAVDPLTGETVWTRHDVPSGCELFGDEELLFAVPPGATEAIVFRALDGEELGRRELPPADKRMSTRGRLVLDWEPAPKGSGRLRLFDVWKQAAVWTKEFHGHAKFHPVADEAVAVMEHDGHLTVLSLADGTATIDQRLPAEKTLAEVYLLRSPDIDVVICNRREPRNANVNVMPAAMNAAGAGGVVVNGMVYGFDRETGEKLWGREVQRKAIALNRPADLPVLLFASNSQRMGRMPQQHGELAIVDKHTGKMLVEKKVDQMMAVDATCDLDKHEVTVVTPRETFRLTYTDQPDDVAQDAAKKRPTSAAGRAVWRALRKQLEPLEEAMDEPTEALKQALGIEDDPFAE